jgi:biotin carboxyl carrier protein
MSHEEVYKTLVVDDTTYQTRWTVKFARRARYQPPDPKKVLAFIPGVIRGIHVRPGQRVRRGDSLVVLEAMKMLNDITALRDGVVKAVFATVGQMLTKGEVILELE